MSHILSGTLCLLTAKRRKSNDINTNIVDNDTKMVRERSFLFISWLDTCFLLALETMNMIKFPKHINAVSSPHIVAYIYESLNEMFDIGVVTCEMHMHDIGILSSNYSTFASDM